LSLFTDKWILNHFLPKNLRLFSLKVFLFVQLITISNVSDKQVVHDKANFFKKGICFFFETVA